jgi:hypothetical protein
MRLINADKLLENLEWLEEYDHIIFEAVKECIDIAQPVKSIPVEWLLKERDKNKKIAEKLSKEDLDIDFISKYGYNRASHKVLMIEELLLDWMNAERENDR